MAAEALARTLRAWRRVRGMGSPDAWVARVTTNLAIDLLRRRKRLGDGSGSIIDIVAGNGTVGIVATASAASAGAGRNDDVDTRILVRDMVRSLPRRQRDVLALRYLADLSEAEIADLLGIAPGSVKCHASRGIDRLRKRLGADATEVVQVAF